MEQVDKSETLTTWCLSGKSYNNYTKQVKHKQNMFSIALNHLAQILICPKYSETQYNRHCPTL